MALLDRFLRVAAILTDATGTVIGTVAEADASRVAMAVALHGWDTANWRRLAANNVSDAMNAGAPLLWVSALPILFNGTNYDRGRSIATSGAGLGVARVATQGEAITLLASAARTAGSATSTPVTGLGWRCRYAIQLDVTAAATDANDTLDTYVDVSVDGSNYINVVRYTQCLGNGGAKRYLATLDSANPGTADVDVSGDVALSTVRPSSFGSAMRVRHAITDPTGSNASFTFSVIAYAI